MREMRADEALANRQNLINHYAAVRQRMSIRPVKPVVVEIKPPPPPAPAPAPEPDPIFLQPALTEAEKRRRVKIADVIKVVSKHFNMPDHEIMSDRRTKEIILARHTVYWLCKECTPMSYPRIGHWLGRRDHTTILHGVRVMQQRIDAGHKIAEDCFYLRDILLGNRASFYWGA